MARRTFWLSPGRAVHVLALAVHHRPGVRDRSLLGRLKAADALHLARALVLDLRHEGSHLAVGRVDACIARFATTSLEAKVAADLVVEVRVIA